MKSISQKIIFFGTEDFSLTALTGLIEAGYPIAAVVTKPDSRSGRGQKIAQPLVKVLASKHNIPVWQPEKLKDITDQIKALQPVAGVLVSFGKIIPQSTIDLFTPGIINVHPSLLPLYRGPSPIESAIKNGDTKTGVTIMQLSAAMDAGPVYLTKEQPLKGTETQPDLYHTLSIVGTDLLLEALPRILSLELQPTPQDDARAVYCELIKKSDGDIDWDQPSTVIDRQIRAYRQWPQSRTTFGTIDVIITSVHASPSSGLKAGEMRVDNGHLSVGTVDGSLVIDRLKPIGKKEMPIQAFLDGYRSVLGI